MIEIENLLHNLPNASYINFKIGTSTITESMRRKQDHTLLVDRNQKDMVQTSKKLGFKVTYYCKKDMHTGRVLV